MFAFVFLTLLASSVALRLPVSRQDADDEDVSHDKKEWNHFIETLEDVKVELVGKDPKICIHNKAVPNFYLLGTQKAGTTSFAEDAFSIGFRSAIGNEKELHKFDKHCKFHTRKHRPSYEWKNNGAPIHQCQNMTETEKLEWVKHFKNCEGTNKQFMYADMTPSNLKIPGLPKVMADLYQEQKSKVVFAILLREPLSRFQSGWYQLGGHKNFHTTFEKHVDEAISKARKIDKQTYTQDYFLDEFSRSMYSLSLGPWLKEFEAKQFIIIPSAAYFRNHTFKESILRDMGQRLQMNLDTSKFSHASGHHANKGGHPKLEKDLASSKIELLQKEFFDPDTRELVKMLATAIPKGLQLKGFETTRWGGPTPSDVELFLRSNW